MKVVQADLSSAWAVVQDDWGECRKDGAGVDYVYLPITVCRVPFGHGRTVEEAERLARVICALLNVHEVDTRGHCRYPVVTARCAGPRTGAEDEVDLAAPAPPADDGPITPALPGS